jgi:hypothetical protein
MRTHARLQMLEDRLNDLVDQVGQPSGASAEAEPVRCQYYKELPSLLKLAQNELGFKIDTLADRITNLDLRAEITDTRLARIEGLQDEIRAMLRDYTGVLNDILDRLPEEFVEQES